MRHSSSGIHRVWRLKAAGSCAYDTDHQIVLLIFRGTSTLRTECMGRFWCIKDNYNPGQKNWFWTNGQAACNSRESETLCVTELHIFYIVGFYVAKVNTLSDHWLQARIKREPSPRRPMEKMDTRQKRGSCSWHATNKMRWWSRRSHTNRNEVFIGCERFPPLVCFFTPHAVGEKNVQIPITDLIRSHWSWLWWLWRTLSVTDVA